MKRADPKKERGEPISIKEISARKNKEEETNDLHVRESATSDSHSVRDAPAASPLRFYARLRHELEIRGINYDGLPKLTKEGESPPCFSLVGASFDAWLSNAGMLGALVPYRFDMPAEPNYCVDCTPEFKHKAMAAGVCRFLNTRFEKSRTVVQDDEGKHTEVEVLGVSRSPLVGIDPVRE